MAQLECDVRCDTGEWIGAETTLPFPMNMLIRKIYPACWHRRRSSTDLEIRGPNPSSCDYAVFNRCLAEQRGATPGECVSTEIAVMFHVKHDRFDYCRLVDAARARAA